MDARTAFLELVKAQNNANPLSCGQFFLVHHRQVRPITLGSAAAIVFGSTSFADVGVSAPTLPGAEIPVDSRRETLDTK